MRSYPNWFQEMIPNFSNHLSDLAGKPLNALQIGAYSGDASLWLMKNVLTNNDSLLCDVDTWRGSPEHPGLNLRFKNVEKVYEKKIKDFKNVKKFKMTSDQFFKTNELYFDFIYIDGHHHSEYVARDAKNALRFSKPGTIIAFDDYEWGAMHSEEERPRRAIDNFLQVNESRLAMLSKGYQVWVKVIF